MDALAWIAVGAVAFLAGLLTSNSSTVCRHRWRGIGSYSDLFLRGWVLGFVTIGWSRHDVSDLLRRYERVLKDIARGK